MTGGVFMKKKVEKQLDSLKEYTNGATGKFAAYPRSSGCKDGMIPLMDCILFDEESKAQWHCIINKEYKYTQIKG